MKETHNKPIQCFITIFLKAKGTEGRHLKQLGEDNSWRTLRELNTQLDGCGVTEVTEQALLVWWHRCNNSAIPTFTQNNLSSYAFHWPSWSSTGHRLPLTASVSRPMWFPGLMDQTCTVVSMWCYVKHLKSGQWNSAELPSDSVFAFSLPDH